MEFNFSGFDINVSICIALEGSPKNEGCFHVLLHIKYYKIHMNEKVSFFTKIFLAIPIG
jgi:hypothetical protein